MYPKSQNNRRASLNKGGGRVQLSSKSINSPPFQPQQLTKFYDDQHSNSEEDPNNWDILNLASHGLRVLSPSVGNYTHITFLLLNNNNLANLPGSVFRSLPSLTTLDVSYNKLSSLPPEIGEVLKLEGLSFAHNKVTSLPIQFGKLSNLRRLDFDGNPLNFPESNIMNKGETQIIRYLNGFLDKMAPIPRQWYRNNAKNPRSVRVMVHNILAACYASESMYPYCEPWCLSWPHRLGLVTASIDSIDPDICCLQEVASSAFHDELVPLLATGGMRGCYGQKSRARTMASEQAMAVDGCATFFSTDKFTLLEEHIISYQTIIMARPEFKFNHDGLNTACSCDNLALVTLLQNKFDLTTYLVVNAHMVWNPELSDVKLFQTILCCQWIEDFLQNGGSNIVDNPQYQPHLVFCGDFNSLPSSLVYQLLDQGMVTGRDVGPGYASLSQHGYQHRLELKSAYGRMCGEPAFTNLTEEFTGTIDYIWAGSGLEVSNVLNPITKEACNGKLFPNPTMPSDHMALAADFTPPSPSFFLGNGWH